FLIDYENEMVIVASALENGVETIIGIGSYVKIPGTKTAEIALVVRDDWQNKGLGTALLSYLIEIGKNKGIESFTAWIFTDNTKMLHLIKKLPYKVEFRIEGDLYHITIKLN
ncbi:MAG: GNAT family N-acetyltransferase, partial [Candidatus Bathyarchaeia archaeon]